VTNIDGKACNKTPEAVNKLAFSARLCHSCEINMIPLIILIIIRFPLRRQLILVKLSDIVV
jgi:hypothetical protein